MTRHFFSNMYISVRGIWNSLRTIKRNYEINGDNFELYC